MKVTNETYVCCPICEMEGKGLEQINERFGYFIKGGDIIPYKQCRECRKEESTLIKNEDMKQAGWASASVWGKKIHINRKIFNSYLIDLGYLKKVPNDNGRKQESFVTKIGEKHSALTSNSFRKNILWDYDTFVKVVKLRTEKAEVHYCCEKCCTPIDELSNFDHLQPEYQCYKCGHVGEVFQMRVDFDR